jgi:hypothetical protein
MLSNLPLIIRASDAEHPPLYHNTPIHTYDRKGAWGFHLRFCIDTTIPGLYFGKYRQSAAGYTTVFIKSIAERLRFGLGVFSAFENFVGWLVLL